MDFVWNFVSVAVEPTGSRVLGEPGRVAPSPSY
jgi:hypothetical protein